MAIERIILQGVEAQLVESALGERQRAEELLGRRLGEVRKAHKLADGIQAQFGIEEGEVVMLVTRPDAPKRDPLAVVPAKIRGGKKH